MIRVLVVDDDFMVARLHGKQVEKLPGFTVVGEARSGAEALAAVRELRPDLVLLDIYLPDISGLDVLRELRRGGGPGSEVDVLVVTAARDADTVRGALRGGAVHYVVKPFETAVLHERLLDYARRHEELTAFNAPGQEEVDRVFTAGPAAPAAPVPLARDPAPPAPGPGTAPGAVGSGAAPGTAAPGTAAQSAAAPGAAVPPAPSGPVAGVPAEVARPPIRGVRLPKGVTEQTAELVRDALADSGDGLSAAECAVATGLSRVSARRYLEFFASSGHAVVRLRYGTTGRPERRYHWR
ncbi:response regulator [Streptomyces zingiberis]|uniref:Response regulator n=1 Tax=Streptomyces zingiberis TaxID=2053010 RepID=A0ABX1BYG7_9ACTN|nr:response regulator [Streptomyces zingiberis]NJQ00727.1 response regulator [Streptomyces zingiberis]